jgi:hypothetical protein
MVTTTSERVKRAAPGLAVAGLVGAGVFLLAYDGGSYGLASRATAAIVLLWAASLAVALGLWPVVRPPRGALATGGLLAAFAAWTGLSAFWASSAERAFLELDRVVLFLAVLAVAVLAGTRASLRRWTDGIALAIAAIGVLALASRLFPNTFPKGNIPEFLPAALSRLSWPVEYWNGLAILVALGLPLLLRAASEPRSPIVRGVAVGLVPALAGTMYLTSSRGGFAAAAVGLAVFLVLTARRWSAGVALAVGLAGSAFVISRLVERSALANDPFGSAEAVAEGRSAAALILLACLACGVAYGLAVAFAPTIRVPLVVSVAVVAVLAAGTVFFVAQSHPVRRFEEFKAMPTDYDETDFVKSHLLSGSGSGRWQFWEGAVDQWRADPVVGQGAGSFEAWWAQNAPFTYFIKDAHSLYLETMGELGLVGIVLLAAMLLSAVVVGLARWRRAAGELQAEVAALLGLLAAYLVAAGIDWVWELTVVSVVAFAAIGLLVGPATLGGEDWEADVPRRERTRARRLAVGAAALLTGWLLIVGQAIPFLASLEIGESQAAVRRGDGGKALSSAENARSIQPWAASPYLQLALVREALDDLPAAREAIEDAIERDPLDWRLWLVRTRLETTAGAIADARESLARARELNPHSPLFAPRE